MRRASFALGALAIGLALGAWWAITAAGLVSPFILPPPAEVIDAARRLSAGYLGGSLATHLQASLSVVLSGYAAAVLVGVPLGILMAWVRPAALLLEPLVSLLRPIPPPAWIPLTILWFGIGLPGKTFVVFISAVTPCLVNAFVAIREVPAQQLRAARSLGAGHAALLFRVAIPSGLPTIAGGMRIALGTAWATVVAAELVVATAGFGFVIMSGYRNFESSIMAVGMIAVAATGFLMNLLFLAIERRVISWSERE